MFWSTTTIGDTTSICLTVFIYVKIVGENKWQCIFEWWPRFVPHYSVHYNPGRQIIKVGIRVREVSDQTYICLLDNETESDLIITDSMCISAFCHF